MVETSKFYTCKYDRAFKYMMLNPKNKKLLIGVIENVLDIKINDLKYLNTELTENNINVRHKIVDILLDTDKGKIEVEVNSEQPAYIRNKNASYIFNLYANHIMKGETYTDDTMIYQINLSYGLNGDSLKEEYMLQDEEGNKFIKNLKIVEVNMDLYKKIWYSKNEEEILKNKYLIMLDLDRVELEEFSKIDKEAEYYMEELERLNKDNSFIEFMTYEEDQRKRYNSDMKESRDAGIKEGMAIGLSEGLSKGLSKATREIASNLKKSGIPLNIISENTGLTIEEIEEL